MKRLFKNALKFVAFIMGAWLIFGGFGSIFLWESKVEKGWSVTFIISGILLMWYFIKK